MWARWCVFLSGVVQFRKHLRCFLGRSACGLALVPSSASSPLTVLGADKVCHASALPRLRRLVLWIISRFCSFGKGKVGGLARCRSLQTVITAAALSRLRRSVGALAALGTPKSAPPAACGRALRALHSLPACCAWWGALAPQCAPLRSAKKLLNILFVSKNSFSTRFRGGRTLFGF